MKRFRTNKLVLALMALTMLSSVLFTVPIFAAAGLTQDVTVTANPRFIAIELNSLAWTVNGMVAGDGLIELTHTYYTNPLGDELSPTATIDHTECYFTLTNTSSVHCDFDMTWGDFGGGGANMLNKDAGAADATHFAGFYYVDGGTMAGKIQLTVAGVNVVEDTGEGVGLVFGLEIDTQTGAFASGVASHSHMVVTAHAHT